MSKYNHFNEYEWLGLFYTPDGSIEFPGKITYTPERGVELDFMCSLDVKMQPCDHLHGALASGEICTLFGKFDPALFGMHLGKIVIRKAKVKFELVVFGVESDKSMLFDGFWADFTNFQELCYPQGFKQHAKYSDKPLCKYHDDDLTIEITNNGKFNFLGDSISSVLHCENPDVIAEIEDSFQIIKEKYKEELIYSRTDIGWDLSLTSINGIVIDDILKKIGLFEGFLSVIIYGPVRVNYLSIKLKSDIQKGKFERHDVLMSLFDISSHKINVLQRKINHHNIPIKPSNVDFGAAIGKWLEHHNSYRSFFPRIANKFGRYYEHEIMSEIIVSLAQIEGIFNDMGKKGEKYKYDHPIDHLDKGIVRNVLRGLLSIAKEKSIGEALSKLRGGIAHFGRPAKILNDMDDQRLLGISICLEIIIATRVYEKLGIPENVIGEFQKYQIGPWLKVYG